MSPLLLTVAKVAGRVGVTEYQVRREHECGILPGRRAVRFLRFTEDNLKTSVERIRDDRATAERSGITPPSRVRRLPR